MPDRSCIGCYMSKSPNSSHMLFIHKSYSKATSSPIPVYTKTLYVWTGGPTIGSPLPPPPVYYFSFMANILSDDEADGSSYKVILAESLGKEKNSVNVQTFSSSTRRWEQYVLTCSTSFTIYPCHGSGAVTTMGGTGSVIYWQALSRRLDCLVVWDINGGSNNVSLILEPEFPSLFRIPFYEGAEIHREQISRFLDFGTCYGVSPNGSLMCILSKGSLLCDFELWTIKIFTFDENTKDWSLLHQVRHGSIWTKNLALLSSLFGVGVKLTSGFVFVSLLPGRVDSILVGLEHHLFMYHFQSQKLEHLDYSKYNPQGRNLFLSHVHYHHPLTLQDLGVWFSSPPSIKLEGGSRKNISSSSVEILAFCRKHVSLLIFPILIIHVILAFLIE